MYNINNCILIRKTDILPTNGIIETPLHGYAYSFGKSSYLGDIINSKLRKEYNNPEDFTLASKEYHVYFETKRRTIHFTINGLVENTMYGNFDYPYTILEPLKYHINDNSLKSLRVEDTYFDDDIELSSEAIVLMNEEDYLKIKDKVDLSTMNIRTYQGIINDAIKNILNSLGYDTFLINNNGYVDGLTPGTKDKEMYDFIRNYAEEYKISQDRHFYSDINHEDIIARNEEAIETDKRHVLYILDNVDADPTLKEEIRILLDENYKEELDKRLELLVNTIGLETIKRLTKEFNDGELEKRSEKITCGMKTR